MNDNKSTVMNNAAVQQLRKVPGFDPMKLLRKTISVKTGHPVWKLDLRYKRLWFRLACPNGRMLLKPLRISDQLAIIEAQVYFSKDDPVPAASFTSEQRRENIPGGEFLRAAQEDALNMALENAGFGIQFCDVNRDYGGELFGSEVPVQTEVEEAAVEETKALIAEETAADVEAEYTAAGSAENYFAQARLERTSSRDESVAALQSMLGGGDRTEDELVTDAIAAVETSKLIESESTIESLIQAQGYSNCIVYLDGDSAKVVVQTEGLDAAQAAAIKDVILGEVSVPAENIRIFEVK